MIRIACLGDNCTDYYDETGEAFFGGNPLNVAVYLRRLGCRSSYLGAVGTDDFGQKMRSAVAGKGVDLSHLQVIEGATALTHVTVRDGERILGDYEEGVMALFRLREEDFVFIAEHDLAVTGLWGHCEKDLPRILRDGTGTAFDCADRPDDAAAVEAAPYADLLFFSDDESDDAAAAKKLRELRRLQCLSSEKTVDGRPRIVIATRGEKGSLAYDGVNMIPFGIVPCTVADTMGAGDSYIAGFIHAYVRGRSLGECMRAGTESSAVTLGYAGAW